MRELFEIVAKFAVLVFVVTCMATAGLGLGVRDVVAPLRRVRFVVLALIVNFVLAPALAYALTKVFVLDQPYAIGLLLVSAAAGAPFLPKLVELAKGEIATSIALMLLLTVGSVIFLPIILPLLVPGMSARAWPILRPLLLTMLLPLSLGMAIRGQSEKWAARVRGVTSKISNISMLLAVVLLIALNFPAMLGTFGSGAVAVAALFVLALTIIGYFAGGPASSSRSVMALGTGQRNIAAALIIATQNSDDPGVVVMLLVSTLVGLVVLLPAAKRLARRSTKAVAPQADSQCAPVHAEVAR